MPTACGSSKIYYNKSRQLSIAQMAYDFGSTQSTSNINPVVNPTRALERRNWLQDECYAIRFNQSIQYQKAIAEPINLDTDRGINNKFPLMLGKWCALNWLKNLVNILSIHRLYKFIPRSIINAKPMRASSSRRLGSTWSSSWLAWCWSAWQTLTELMLMQMPTLPR